MTAFIITRDYITKKDEEGYGVGVIGPRSASDKDMERLRAGEGIKFRLLDDDGNVYYHGRRLEVSDCDHEYYSENELAPLDCYGTPNAGAVWQQEKNADGEWEGING